MKLLKPLVLASRSPRRVLLLRQIGMDALVMPCDLPEEFSKDHTPEENARLLALMKARAVAADIENAVVVGADTIVLIDDEMLGKPSSRDEAIAMLERLSGRTHTVLTGFALVDRPSNRERTEVESTRVSFRVLPREEIEAYVDNGSPMDKAGAYGIQDDYGAVFVTRIEGCFYNVVGFPLSKFYTTLQEFQLNR